MTKIWKNIGIGFRLWITILPVILFKNFVIKIFEKMSEPSLFIGILFISLIILLIFYFYGVLISNLKGWIFKK